MGMFDYLKCEYKLPDLGSGADNDWISSPSIFFQTKDTPSQTMSTYIISPNGELFEDYSAWNKEYQKSSIGGVIRFYETMRHPDDNMDFFGGDNPYEMGWVELEAVFNNGNLVGEISLVEFRKPKKLSEEEFLEQKKANEQWQEDNAKNQREWRKESPSPSQKLIDSIYLALDPCFAISEIEDLSSSLEKIKTLINEYRQKHDQWYEQ